jgi:endonuclease YncB( thermonuclease family)
MQGAVRFANVRVDTSGTVRADGHDLDLYGLTLLRRTQICTSAQGARWTCGQHAFMAVRKLLDGMPITCDFKHETAPPKAVCRQESGDIAQFLLAEGWAQRADGVTDEAYVEAAALAKNRKAGIWGDGPP